MREGLAGFVTKVFTSLPWADQRFKGNLCVQGLIFEGRRKFVQSVRAQLG